MNEQVTEYINNAPKAQKAIMDILRSLIHQQVAGVTESFKWSRPVFRLKKDFAYFQSNKGYVNLGFYNAIDQLDDPKGLLEGTGKAMRHIKLRGPADIDPELLSKWLRVGTQA